MDFTKIVEREIKKEFKKLIDKYDLYEIELTNKERIFVLTSKGYFDEQFDHKLMKVFDNFFGRKLYYVYNPNSYGEKDCKECDLYGECDHQGAYQKDGKWCYEDSKSSKFKEHKCPKCNSILQEYHVREYMGGDEEFSLICPNCGRIDPSDLIDLNKVDPKDTIVIEYDIKKMLKEKEKDIKNLIKKMVEKDINDRSNKY